MSQENARRKKIAQGLVIAASMAGIGWGIADMLRSLRKHS